MKHGVLAVLALAGLAYAQGPARTVHVSAPRAHVIAGEQLQLTAIARDVNGVARTGDTFSWVSSNNNFATVNAQGLVTARGLGLVDITAQIAGATAGAVRIQVLPLRVDVFPGTGEVLVGDRLQYTALAFDVNEAVIPNAPISWTVTGANGGGTQAATITGQGLFTARASGLITVRGFIGYGGGNNPFISQFSGYARIRIKSRNQYRLTRLLSSDEERHSFQLRPVPGSEIAVNDAGQVAYVGSLDGLSTALLLYENGRFDLLAAAGWPGPTAGGFIFNFSSPSINNRGQVLIRVGMQNSNSGVLLASREGSAWVQVDGQPGGGVENLGGSTIWRDSLNDNGDFVFPASFQLAGSTTRYNGLFRYTASSGAIQRLWSSNDALPGLNAPIGFAVAGIDRDGVVYFLATSGPNTAIYRQERFLPPTKVLGPGDALGGSTLTNAICCWLGVGAAGDVAFRAQLANGTNAMVRVAGADVQVLPIPGGHWVSVNSRAGVLFRGDAGRGWGLYRWQGGMATPVLLEGRLAPNEEPLRFVQAAQLTGRGDVIAQVSTADNPFVVIQPGGPRPVLFDTGTRVNVTANLNLSFGSLVRGLGSGPPRLLLGSLASIFEIDTQGLVPRLVLGDRMPDGALYNGINRRFESSAGDLYFDAAGNSNRVLAGDRVENLILGQFRTEDGVNVNRGLVWGVNDRGAIVWDAGTDRVHGRLYLTEGGRHTLLATSTQPNSTQFTTPSPAGGTISGWNSVAIDDLGRVMAVLNVRNGPSGVFLWANGRWQATALFTQYMIGTQRLTNAFNLQAVGERFYAGLQAGISHLAEFREQGWTILLTQGDAMPNGSSFNGLGALDVNRRGEMAFMAGLQGGGTGVFVRSGGEIRTVYINNEPTDGGEYLRNFGDVELREDGRVFFTAADVFDRVILYVAEPLLTNWPARSRQ